MRLVDVHVDADHPLDVVLHPRVNVITGEDVAIQQVAAALARAFVLAGRGVSGTIEFTGFHSTLDPSTVVSLDLQGEGLRVLDPSVLPPPGDADTATAARQERTEAAAARLSALAERTDALLRRREATAAALAVVAAELAEAQQVLVEAGAAHEDGDRRRDELEAVMVDTRRRVADADAHLSVARQAREDLLAALSLQRPGARALRSGMDTAPQQQVVAAAVAAGVLDVSVGARLEKWLAKVRKGRADPDPDVVTRLGEIDDLERRWAEVSRRGVEDEPEVTAARTHKLHLDERLAALEELSASGILAERARAEIDAAHEERVRIESERHVKRATLEAAIRAEHEVASKYGFDSYMDYSIALSTMSVGDTVEQTLERVRMESLAAGDALDAIRDAEAAKRAELSERRAALREQLSERVGGQVTELSSEELRRIPRPDPAMDGLEELTAHAVAAIESAAAALAAELELRGAELAALDSSPPPESGDLLDLHHRARELAVLRDRAEEEHRRVDADLAARAEEAARWRAELDSLAAPEPDDPDGHGYRDSDVAMVVQHIAPMVDPGGIEPVPLLMVDTLAPLGRNAVSALEALLAAAVRVQVIYLTTDPGLVAWAESLDPQAGHLVRLPRPGWLERAMPFRRRRSSQGASG